MIFLISSISIKHITIVLISLTLLFLLIEVYEMKDSGFRPILARAKRACFWLLMAINIPAASRARTRKNNKNLWILELKRGKKNFGSSSFFLGLEVVLTPEWILIIISFLSRTAAESFHPTDQPSHDTNNTSVFHIYPNPFLFTTYIWKCTLFKDNWSFHWI